MLPRVHAEVARGGDGEVHDAIHIGSTSEGRQADGNRDVVATTSAAKHRCKSI